MLSSKIGKGRLNPEASSTNRITGGEDESWGDVPKEWKGETGSMLVVRQYGRDLEAGEAKAIGVFFAGLLGVLISQTRSGAGDSRECLLREFMGWATFELWVPVRRVRMMNKGVDKGLENSY